MFYFYITKCRIAMYAPINNSGAFINEAFFVQGNKDFSDRFATTFIHALNRIEAEVGAPLFDRGRIPLTITIPGEIYLEKARKILNLNTEIKNQISDISNYQRKEITIGITRFLQFYYLPPTLPKLRAKYPKMKINIVVDTPPNLTALMLAGNLDIAFMPPLIQDGINNISLFNYRSLLLMSINNPLAQNYKMVNSDYPSINFSDLKNEDFILITSSHFLRSAFFQLCKKHGITPRIGLEMDSFLSLFATVANGYGVTILPEAMLRDGTNIAKVAAFNIKDQPLIYPIAMVYPDKEYMPSAIKDIIEYAPHYIPQE